jgi:small subunit ribosomal protein S27Ae
MAKKKIVKKGKKPHKNKKTSTKYKQYKISGTTLTKGRFCPRCGPGVFLLVAKERVYCGKCHYSEFTSKQKEIDKK